MPMLHKNSFVVAMISQTRKEDTSGEEGDLYSLDVDVDPVLVPGPRPQRPGDNRRKNSVKV